MAYLKLERLVEYEQEWVVELYKNMQLQASTDRADYAAFIEFILQMILDAIVASSASDQDTVR